MPTFNATDIIITVNGSTVGLQTSGELTLANDLPDASNKDSAGWAEHIRGQRSWSLAIEGIVDYGASFGVEELADLILTRTAAAVTFGTSKSGDLRFSGNTSLGDLTPTSAPNEDVPTYSGTLTGNGPLTKLTIP